MTLWPPILGRKGNRKTNQRLSLTNLTRERKEERLRGKKERRKKGGEGGRERGREREDCQAEERGG